MKASLLFFSFFSLVFGDIIQFNRWIGRTKVTQGEGVGMLCLSWAAVLLFVCVACAAEHANHTGRICEVSLS